MEKVGFILEKNDSPLFIQSNVRVIKENGTNYVDFRLSDDDFNVLYLALRFGIVDPHCDSERLSSLLDLFHSVHSRL